MFPYTSPRRCRTGAPGQPSAVSSDEGPYSKGSRETATSDQSHLSHRRSFSGTNHAALSRCKSAPSIRCRKFLPLFHPIGGVKLKCCFRAAAVSKMTTLINQCRNIRVGASGIFNCKLPDDTLPARCQFVPAGQLWDLRLRLIVTKDHVRVLVAFKLSLFAVNYYSSL